MSAGRAGSLPLASEWVGGLWGDQEFPEDKASLQSFAGGLGGGAGQGVGASHSVESAAPKLHSLGSSPASSTDQRALGRPCAKQGYSTTYLRGGGFRGGGSLS